MERTAVPPDYEAAPTPFSELSLKKPEYLGHPHFPPLPRGRLVLLEGDPDTGKTWLCLDLAARVSRGRYTKTFEGESRENTGKVFYLAPRDCEQSVLGPRLEKCGADLSQVSFIHESSVTWIGEKGEKTLDLEALSQMMAKERPDLLVIDPIDLYPEKNPRWSLRDLDFVASVYQCTILLVRHLKRTPGGRPVRPRPDDARFQAASVLLAAVDPEDPQKRILAHARNVYGRRAESRGFEAREESGIEWGEARELSAEELLYPPKEETPDHPSALHKAREFLIRTLADGREVTVKQVQEGAALEGISKKTLLRAKKSLGVQSTRDVWNWHWILPREPQKNDGLLGHLPPNTPEEPVKMNRAERRRLEREERKEAGRMEVRG
ncbi:MAG: AAA family ATPase [Bdellovibrionota bacterium]